MKIAYLLTAYLDPFQLKRLCEALLFEAGEDSSDVYLHIDRKVDITPFVNVLQSNERVHFCKNRYYINWGGFNQVLAQRELLGSALNSGTEYDRLVCISATDYPLWSNQKIVVFFKRYPTLEMVGGYDITDSPSMWQKHKVVYFHFFRDLPVPVKIRRIFSYGSRTILKSLGLNRSPYVKLKDGQKVHIYTGSDYWAITRNCARYVYDCLSDDSPYVKRLRHTYIPSELIINTIVYNSDYKEHATPLLAVREGEQEPGLDKLTPLHYIEYDGAIRVWTSEDYDKLVASGKMFCRKTLSGVSDSLVERIDRELR